jgi:hypothetical protein
MLVITDQYTAIYMMSAVKRILHQRYADGDRSTWLLGDSGYPLEPYLLTPIEGANPEMPEGRYTQAHKTTRNCVERCISKILLQMSSERQSITLCSSICRQDCVIMCHFTYEHIIIQYDDELDDYEDLEDVNLFRQGQHTRNNLIFRQFM